MQKNIAKILLTKSRKCVKLHSTALTSFLFFSGKSQRYTHSLNIGINNRHVRGQLLRDGFLHTNFHEGEILFHEEQAR